MNKGVMATYELQNRVTQLECCGHEMLCTNQPSNSSVPPPRMYDYICSVCKNKESHLLYYPSQTVEKVRIY